MYYQIFWFIVALMTNHSCSSGGRLLWKWCKDRGEAACLNYEYDVIDCYLSIGECEFVFVCPSGFRQNQTACSRYVNESCPEINELKYQVQHPDIDFIPIPNESTQTQQNEPVCSFSMEALFKAGRPVSKFTLTFDWNEGELVLSTSLDLNLEYIQCYSKGPWRINMVDFKLIPTRAKDLFRRYQIEIDEEPMFFFCLVSAPGVFVRTITKNVLAYSNTTPNQYIYKLVMNHVTTYDEDVICNIPNINCKLVKKEIKGTYLHSFFYFQDLNLFSFDRIQSILRTHVLTKIKRNYKEAYIEYLRNIDYCLHDVTTNGILLHWNTTLLGTWSTPQELCLDANGIPITRRCAGEFLTGAIWSEPSGNCSEEIEIPERTTRLHQLVKEEIITEVFANITAVTDDFKVFAPVDVNLLSDGLKSLSATRNVTSFQEDFLLGVSNTMRINSTVLRESQEQLNSTDKILDSLENFVMNVAEDITNLSTTIHSNVLTQISSPFISYVIGLALYKKDDKEFDQSEIVDVTFDQTFEDLILEKLELAVYIPTDFIRNITNNLTPQEKEKFKIINTVFYSDSLFNDVSNENRSAGSRVVNVNIPAFVDNKQVPVNVLFRPTLNFTGSDCVFWDYGRQKQGKWSTSEYIILEKYGNESLLQCTFNHIAHFALSILTENIIITDNPLESHEYCLPDVTTNGILLHWNTTLIGTWSTPRELCLDANRIPVTRRCVDEFLTGAIWSEPSGNCSKEIEIPERTTRLHQLVEEEIITEVFANITAVTDDFKVFTPVDVNLLSDGLKSLSATRNVTSFQEDFLLGVSNTMRINSTVLRESQEQLNSTDKILDSLENFVMNVAEDITNLSTTIHSNVLTQISSPFISYVIGLALYKKDDKEFDQSEIVDVTFDQTFEDLILEKLELAVYIPTDFIRNITNNLTPQEKEKFKIINTVFYSDSLFNDVSNENRSAGSRVVNVNIPAFVDNKQVPVNVLFRPTLNFTGSDCVFWDYGRQKQGKWSTSEYIILEKYGNETLLQCTFNHITHFALLVLSESIVRGENGLQNNPLESHELALTLITLIGCGLSLIGSLVMLFSALVFKGWYRKRLNSLQLAIVLLMEIIILFVADLDILKDGDACKAIGALLHYIVLTKFIWMLIIARLQYLKFVAILENLQVKSRTAIYMIVGWVLPVIPVVLTLLIFSDNYQSGELNFCYAKGYALYFFLILPACVIIFINVRVFASIMTTISESKAQDYGVDMMKVQIRLGVLLFFMLGITWIFGILTHFLPFGWLMLVMIYLFCVLAPLQGFVLFVFNVLMDKTTVNLWKDKFGITPRGARSYDVLTRSEVLYSSQSENATVTYFRKRK